MLHQKKMKHFFAIVMCLAFAFTISAQSISKNKQYAIDQAEGLSQLTEELAMQTWQHSELPLTEAKSSQLLQSTLAGEGFSLEVGMSDMPTAFVATYGSGKPVIGILAEFDALPGIGNEVTLISGVYEYLLNRPMQVAMYNNLMLAGGPEYTSEEQAWGKQLQASADKPTVGFDGNLSST